MENTKCLICGSKELKPYQGYEIHGLVVCNSCGFIFMKRIPTEEELQAHYALYPYDKEQYLSPVTVAAYNELLHYFERFRETNHILDVGCGQGWLLDISMQHRWDAYGTEYSKVAALKCEKKGIKMKEGVLNPADYPKNYFDVVILSEVIEHINNPLEELEKIYTVLRDGGLLYITTPNFNSYLRYQVKEKYNIIHYPEHLSYYTKKTLDDVLSRSGFKKLKLEATGISISRCQGSLDKDHEPVMDSTSQDEKLRMLMQKNTLMKIVKKSANKILSVSGLGMTLKAYYIK
jgi:SAM-dependent methyltransferase